MYFTGGLPLSKPNPTWLTAAILNHYDVITYNSAADDPIPMKCGTLMENHMLMTMKRSKSKPEVEF